jgi:rhodanese-related sulfurtransferase
MGAMGALVLAIALAAYVGYKWWWRHRFLKQLRMDRVTVAELRRLLDEGRSPLILDVRVEMLEIESGVIPGAVTVRAAGADAIAGESLAGVEEAIVYCSCPNEFTAARVALALKRRGVKKVRPLLGGIDAWIEAGYALERPRMPDGATARTSALQA